MVSCLMMHLYNLLAFSSNDSLSSFAEDKEKDHQRLLSAALNIVLLEFRSRQFGEMPTPSDQANGEELIFIPNKHTESSHIQDHISRSKRKPDIIATFISTLRQVYDEHKDSTYEEWVRLDSECDSERSSTPGLRWTDIHQVWEIDLPRKDDPIIPDQYVKHAHPSKKSVDPSLSRRQNGLKRPSDEEEHVQRKRARVCSRPETEPLQFMDNQGNLMPEFRWAYYAAERLSAGWYISHSTAVLLEGELSWLLSLMFAF